MCPDDIPDKPEDESPEQNPQEMPEIVLKPPPDDALMPDMTRDQLMVMTLVVEGGLFVVALALGWLFSMPFWVHMPVTLSAVGIGFAASLPMLLLAVGLDRVTWEPVLKFQQDFDKVLEIFKRCTILDLLAISFLAGLTEEALFRGVLQPLVERYFGMYPALIAVSVLFGLAHYISPMYAALVFFIGLYLGGLYLWFDNLMVPMVTHAVYDFLVLVYGCRFKANRS